MLNSKDKGKRYELEVAKYLREFGFEVKRSVQYCGKGGESADLIGLPFIHIECKHNEHLNIDEALEQAVRDHKENRIPTVWHRKNGKKTKVTMYADDFMKIYGEYFSSMILAGMEDKE